MKHDETNFGANHENPSLLDAELEARVVAWVAGEASVDEAAALERLAATNPAVRAFQREMAAVQGLVVEGMRAETEPLRLAAGRRQKLLATLNAPRKSAAPVPLRERSAPLPKQPSWWSWRGPRIYFMSSGLAAACLVGLLLVRMDRQELRVVEMEAGRAYAPRDEASSSLAGRDARMSAQLRERAAAADVGVFVNKAREAKDRESVGTAPMAMPLMAPVPPAPPASMAQETLPVSAPSTLTESFRGAGADGPVKLDAFMVNEERTAGYAAAAAVSAGTVTLNYGASAPATLGGTVALSGARPSAPAPNNTADSMVSFDRAAPAAPVTPAEGLTGKKAEAQFAGNAAAPGTGFSPTPAKAGAGDDVVRLEAFTIAAPPKQKILGSIGRAVSSFFAHAAPSGETSTGQQPISTFSLHVSDVSFRLATAAVAGMVRGESVTEPKIRAEEFYNAFDYGDPTPTTAEKIAARIEQSAHPFLQQRNFVRIAMKVAATGRTAGQPLRLTVLLDTSGSMEREDRAAAVRRALEVLVSLLGPNDRITVIGFARQPRLLAENLPGDRAREALAVIARTPAEGGTNLEAALKLGSELARRHLTAGAQNRIVVLTDGAANLGNAEPARLTAAVETLRQQGIAFDACGVGLEGIGDTVLEALTRKGNGRYYALDSAETADASFARQLAGAFRPAAENVKLQVRFNPARVGRYRLIGFEEHRLKTEDFRNDAVDAAELAAEEAAVALYQVEVLPQGTGELGEVFVRFRDAATGEMVERSWSMPYEERVPAFAKTTPSLRLAGVAALLAEKFLETPVADQFKLGDLAEPVNALRREYASQPRVQELVTMFTQMRQLTRE